MLTKPDKIPAKLCTKCFKPINPPEGLEVSCSCQPPPTEDEQVEVVIEHFKNILPDPQVCHKDDYPALVERCGGWGIPILKRMMDNYEVPGVARNIKGGPSYTWGGMV